MNDTHIIHRSDGWTEGHPGSETNWRLDVEPDGEVRAWRNIPYDGHRVFKTGPIEAPGGVPSRGFERRGSMANLPVERVIRLFAKHCREDAGENVDVGELRAGVREALESDGVNTNGAGDMDLLAGSDR